MGGSVLIIDGDQQFAESAQSALEAAGITAHVRPDASLDVVRALRPHVLMLNVELPRGSGFSICSRIRRDKALTAKRSQAVVKSAIATDAAIRSRGYSGGVRQACGHPPKTSLMHTFRS